MVPLKSSVKHGISLVKRELVQDGARQFRGAPVMRDSCVLWWSHAVVPMVCGQAQQGATHHVGMMGRTLPGDQWPWKATLGVENSLSPGAVELGAGLLFTPGCLELKVHDQAGARLGCRRISKCFERLIHHQH